MFVLAFLLQSAAPNPAPMLPPLHGGPADMVCPIGGERFSAWRPGTYSTYGERPDGKPYSYLPFPFPLPECPSNRLIVFDDFTDAEKASLARIIATTEYKALVAASETSYYRAYWLATRLRRPDGEALGLLLQAIWQVSPGEMSGPGSAQETAQMARYQAAFIDRVRAQKPDRPAEERLWTQARAANAARQLARFDDARTLHAQAMATLAKIGETSGWDVYLAKLGVVITRRDAAIEPLDMVPTRRIASVCAERSPASAFEKAVCAKPDIAEQVARLRSPAPRETP